jgi:hypothetical protein
MANLEYKWLTILFYLCQNDEFERQPTDTEIKFGKFHGVLALIEYTHGRWKPTGSSGEKAVNCNESHDRAEGGKKVVKLASWESKDKRTVEEDSKGSADTSSSNDNGGEDSA